MALHTNALSSIVHFKKWQWQVFADFCPRDYDDWAYTPLIYAAVFCPVEKALEITRRLIAAGADPCFTTTRDGAPTAS
eukprot:SAG31_NODE_34626_length_331_cov_0.672414_1_plen_77_part_01